MARGDGYIKDLTGLKFGSRIVIGQAHRDPSSARQKWRYACDCGHIGESLRQGLVQWNRYGGSGGCKWCAHKAQRPNRRKRPYEATFNSLKNRGRHPVMLTYEEYYDIAKNEPPCHYCGAAIKWAEYRGIQQQSGSHLDRKDASGPYSKENVVPC